MQRVGVFVMLILYTHQENMYRFCGYLDIKKALRANRKGNALVYRRLIWRKVLESNQRDTKHHLGLATQSITSLATFLNTGRTR